MILFQFALKDRVVSSAYISWWSCSNVKAYHSQIREIKKDRGLIPAVPSCLTGFGWDGMYPSFTNCHQPARYDWNQATLSGLAPYTDDFINNRLWSSMSKALWKSTNTSPVSSSLSILNKILSVILISAVSVELSEWKADCNYSYSKLFSWRYFNSDFATCCRGF